MLIGLVLPVMGLLGDRWARLMRMQDLASLIFKTFFQNTYTLSDKFLEQQPLHMSSQSPHSDLPLIHCEEFDEFGVVTIVGRDASIPLSSTSIGSGSGCIGTGGASPMESYSSFGCSEILKITILSRIERHRRLLFIMELSVYNEANI
jgi:hypothetical protein